WRSMPTYFTVVLLLWKLILLNTQYPVYHELKGLHQSASASFIVSPNTSLLQDHAGSSSAKS
ncbi:MAG TPA: hypothetical protein VK395_27590, partial [Gemmataceae bacterium]|nr:hypothetical protein [Gemmataceae bacterium]